MFLSRYYVKYIKIKGKCVTFYGKEKGIKRKAKSCMSKFTRVDKLCGKVEKVLLWLGIISTSLGTLPYSILVVIHTYGIFEINLHFQVHSYTYIYF